VFGFGKHRPVVTTWWIRTPLDPLFGVEIPGLRCVNPNHLLGYIGMYNFEIIFGERERDVFAMVATAL
jgi:hypothetical protein